MTRCMSDERRRDRAEPLAERKFDVDLQFLIGGYTAMQAGRDAQPRIARIPRSSLRLALVGARAMVCCAPAQGWLVDRYKDIAELCEPSRAMAPDAVLLDGMAPGASAAGGGVRQIRTRFPQAIILLLLTAQARPGDVMLALMRGASGCLIEPLDRRDLGRHLCMAFTGRLVLCESADRLLLNDLHRLGGTSALLRMSPRECEVMLCLSNHRSNKECAESMGITAATVHAHLAKIYKKLGVHDRRSAVRVFQQGLLGGGGINGIAVLCGLDHF
jgi:DNA-binding NarL/FixJ family response regulator